MPTPKTVLMTTAIAATSTVSRSDCIASASVRMPRRFSNPPSKVRCATSDTGQATRKNR